MVMVVTGFLDLFSDLGTSAAVISAWNSRRGFLSSILWFNAVLGTSVALIVFLIAPAAAVFYGDNRVEPLMQFLSLTFVIAGFRGLPQALLQKTLAFNRIAKLEITAAAVSTFVVLTAAFTGQGAWSLAYQTLAGTMFMTLGLWVMHPWRPSMVFDWRQLKSILNYGLNLTGFSVFNYFARNADNLLIGKFLGATELGYYEMAYRLMMYPLQTLWSVLGRVLFPIYAQMQDDHARFGAAFLKVAASIALVAFPAMIGLMLVAEPFVITLFGIKWEPMVPVLVILAGVGAIQSVGTTVGSIYQAKGRTDWLLRWGIVSGLMIVIAFVIGLRWGIVGVAAAYAAVVAMLTYPSFAIPFRLIDLRFSQLLLALWRPFAATTVMAGVILAAKLIIGTHLNPAGTLSALVSAGVVSYILASWWIDQTHLRELAGAFGVRIRR